MFVSLAGRELVSGRRFVSDACGQQVARLGRLLEHPAIRPALVVAGVAFALRQALAAASGDLYVLYDAHAYWSAAALDDPYRSTIQGGFDGLGGLYEYKYPPVLAQLLAPVHLLPWPVFAGLWTLFLFGILLVVSDRWAFVALLFPPVLGELHLGNINLLIGLAIVLGLRWPALWSFVLVTKLTPGIGLLWFLVRREWRSLAVALGATATVAGISYLAAPSLWSDWLVASRTQIAATIVLRPQSAPIVLPVRLAVAAVLVLWGARTDRPWVLPVAASLAVPFAWWNVLAIAVAAIPLVGPPPAWLGQQPSARHGARPAVRH